MKSRNIIAILRGVRPSEVIQIGNVLIAAGINVIEVPLNSPKPFDSITKLKTELGDSAKIGAGTVLTVEDVSKLKDAGGELVVSPNCDIDVIKATKVAGMKSYPGVFTPTECFAALRAGADGLKFFPGQILALRDLALVRHFTKLVWRLKKLRKKLLKFAKLMTRQ